MQQMTVLLRENAITFLIPDPDDFNIRDMTEHYQGDEFYNGVDNQTSIMCCNDISRCRWYRHNEHHARFVTERTREIGLRMARWCGAVRHPEGSS